MSRSEVIVVADANRVPASSPARQRRGLRGPVPCAASGHQSEKRG
eukprot:COSAG01_NODE_57996_length_308_cov_15.760766_1_plen_44_part_01